MLHQNGGFFSGLLEEIDRDLEAVMNDLRAMLTKVEQ